MNHAAAALRIMRECESEGRQAGLMWAQTHLLVEIAHRLHRIEQALTTDSMSAPSAEARLRAEGVLDGHGTR